MFKNRKSVPTLKPTHRERRLEFNCGLSAHQTPFISTRNSHRSEIISLFWPGTSPVQSGVARLLQCLDTSAPMQ